MLRLCNKGWQKITPPQIPFSQPQIILLAHLLPCFLKTNFFKSSHYLFIFLIWNNSAPFNSKRTDSSLAYLSQPCVYSSLPPLSSSPSSPSPPSSSSASAKLPQDKGTSFSIPCRIFLTQQKWLSWLSCQWCLEWIFLWVSEISMRQDGSWILSWSTKTI